MIMSFWVTRMQWRGGSQPFHVSEQYACHRIQ